MNVASVFEGLSAAKHAAIIEAAQKVFLEKGYGAAAMDEVAREAGVAKQTVYKHFGSKDALFQAIVEEMRSRLLEPIALEAPERADPAAVLTEVGRSFLALVVDPVSVRMFRLLVAEAPRFPELAEAVFRSGPERLVAELAAWLERQTRAGRLDVRAPEVAAEQFFGALRGNIQLRAVFASSGTAPAIAAESLEGYVRTCVAAFIRAYGRRRPA